MSRKRYIFSLAAAALCLSQSANAWFFFVPIPNFAKPAPLNKIIDALEKSEETKAVAYVSENKTFGSKYWVWGEFSGHVTQAEADNMALSRCQANLANAKAQTAGGKPLYDFGAKVCELHSFINKTVSPRVTEQQRPATINPTLPSTSPQAVPGPVAPARDEPVPLPVPMAPALPTTAEVPAAPVHPTDGPSPPKVDSTPIAPALSAETVTPKSQALESSTARRLRELNELRKEGLISEKEYNEKRKAILLTM